MKQKKDLKVGDKVKIVEDTLSKPGERIEHFLKINAIVEVIAGPFTLPGMSDTFVEVYGESTLNGPIAQEVSFNDIELID